VNVPVNPAGRFGAPETEPGPCGVGDVFMRIPSHGLSRTWNQRRVPRREKSQGQPLAGTLALDVLPLAWG
jgi:hypothetical protein